jgi:transposase
MLAAKEGKDTDALYASHKICYALTIALETLIADPKYNDEFTVVRDNLLKLTNILSGTDEEREKERQMLKDQTVLNIQQILNVLENIK